MFRSLKIVAMLAGGSPEPAASAAAGSRAPVSLPGTLFVDIRRFALNEESRESAAGSAPVAEPCKRGYTADSAGAFECLVINVCNIPDVASEWGKLDDDWTGDCHMS